ncbi:SCO0930 family lipoprotein [Actinocorallia lasiicapitis]
MRIRPIWAFPLAAVATTGILFTANAVTGSTKDENKPSAFELTNQDTGDEGGDGEAPEPQGAAKPVALSVQNDPSLGKIVVDGKGWTLYRFDKDTAEPSVSNCEDDCAKAWPPVKSSDDVQLKGVSKSLVGTTTRADGSEQVTLGGWPLYRYAKDTQPGDTNGQGVGGAWFASNPAGKKAKAAADTPPAPQEPAPPKPSTTTPPQQNNGGGQNNWKGWTVLKAVKDAKLNWIVVDGKGWTLYRFDKDVQNSKKSNCNGDCAKAWPPVKFQGKLKLTGVSKNLIGNIMRADGICQVTLNGWPLYRYAKDTQPGDTNGHGVGGVWWATTPEGKKAQATQTQPSTDDSAGDQNDDYGDGGYTY